MTALNNKRILILEDEFVVAAMAEDMLVALGASVVGPAGTIAKGLLLAQNEAVDAALLDVNMNGERSDPVAEALKARGVPIVFATGYGERAWKDAPDGLVLDKPYTEEKLLEALTCALKNSGRS